MLINVIILQHFVQENKRNCHKPCMHIHKIRAYGILNIVSLINHLNINDPQNQQPSFQFFCVYIIMLQWINQSRKCAHFLGIV